MSRGFVAVVALMMLAVTACSSGSSKSNAAANAQPPVSGETPWPAPSDPMARTIAAGLQPETAERLEYHVHAHLDVFQDGKRIIVPGGIGIDTTNPNVQKGDTGGFPAYGGITGCDKPCISPLHTHDASGTLHTESATRKNNTFGQFLTEWGVTLPAGTLVYVNGKKFDGDPKTIPLSNNKEIAVVIGTPPSSIPNSP
jgi:hypothetical protein